MGALTPASRGFRWRDGSSAAVVLGGLPWTTTPWGGGQPDNFSSGQDCTTMTNGGGIWDDLQCSALQPFVCEGQASAATARWRCRAVRQGCSERRGDLGLHVHV
ncbi:MAG: hypothetical protein IPG17_16320 [Sandaracinaceae bacterium]|nr:hypothetical protein [Sandaracinaceae bacterium]